MQHLHCCARVLPLCRRRGPLHVTFCDLHRARRVCLMSVSHPIQESEVNARFMTSQMKRQALEEKMKALVTQLRAAGQLAANTAVQELVGGQSGAVRWMGCEHAAVRVCHAL
mgnify:CR=1 FL=1